MQLLITLHAHEVPGLHSTSTLECLEVLQDRGILDAEDTDAFQDAWLMATNTRNALVLTRGEYMDQLSQPGRQLAQAAGATGWEASDSNGFVEHYLRLTRHSSRIVNRMFWGEENPDHE